jgi:hypothetical protein
MAVVLQLRAVAAGRIDLNLEQEARALRLHLAEPCGRRTYRKGGPR